MGIGDWGLGIGQNAQSLIPSTQSPHPHPHLIIYKNTYKKNKNFKI